MTDAVPGQAGDNLFFVWLIDWYGQALTNGFSPVSVPILNAPEGWTLALNEMTPVSVLLVLPIWSVAGPVVAYNGGLVLSFVLTGWFAYLWVTRLTGSRWAGVCAACMVAFVPYRLGHTHGHMNLMGTQWLVLYFWCLTTWLMAGGRRWAIGSGLALAAVAGTSQYYLVMTLLLSLVAGWHLLPRALDRATFRREAVLAGAAAVPLVVLLVTPYLQLWETGTLAPHPWVEVREWSASPLDFVLPTPVHWLVGPWLNFQFHRVDWVEAALNPGWLTAALAVVGWWHARRTHHQPLVRLLLDTAAVAGILAMGVELRGVIDPVLFPVPASFEPWLTDDGAALAMPGYYLFESLPFYGGMRIWMRWGIFITICLAPVAGLGAARLIGRWRWGGARVAGLGLALLVLMEFAQAPYAMTPVGPRPVDLWLAAQPESGVVLQLPAGQLGDPAHTLATAYHRKQFVGAFFGAHLTPQFLRHKDALGSFPSEEASRAIETLDARWILIDLDHYQDALTLEREAARLGFIVAARQGRQLVLMRSAATRQTAPSATNSNVPATIAARDNPSGPNRANATTNPPTPPITAPRAKRVMVDAESAR